MVHCPCGSGKYNNDCCDRFIKAQQLPVTPEELMRSRYTAYTQANIDYIIATMKSPAADQFDAKTAKKWAQQTVWIKLEVLKTSIQETIGFVEFIAHFSLNNKKQFIHELSQFHLENGKWYYVDGKEMNTQIPVRVTHINRNELCPCGSGKKFKKCCQK